MYIFHNIINEGFRCRPTDSDRFLTPDPLEYIDGLNPYIYCSQNPWGKFDALGLRTWGDFFADFKHNWSASSHNQRHTERLDNGNPLRFMGEGFKTKEIQNITENYKIAQDMASNAYLSTLKDSNTQAYIDSFGKQDTNGKNKIIETLHDTSERLSKGNTIRKGVAPTKSTMAFVRDNDLNTVHLTAKFFTRPDIGYDSKSEIFVHEVSHQTGHTDDIKYGVNADNLARENPRQTVHNAASYSRYAVRIQAQEVKPPPQENESN